MPKKQARNQAGILGQIVVLILLFGVCYHAYTESTLLQRTHSGHRPKGAEMAIPGLDDVDNRIRDLYATHPGSEPGWYAVRELFRKIEENERIGGVHENGIS